MLGHWLLPPGNQYSLNLFQIDCICVVQMEIRHDKTLYIESKSCNAPL